MQRSIVGKFVLVLKETSIVAGGSSKKLVIGLFYLVPNQTWSKDLAHIEYHDSNVLGFSVLPRV